MATEWVIISFQTNKNPNVFGNFWLTEDTSRSAGCAPGDLKEPDNRDTTDIEQDCKGDVKAEAEALCNPIIADDGMKNLAFLQYHGYSPVLQRPLRNKLQATGRSYKS